MRIYSWVAGTRLGAYIRMYPQVLRVYPRIIRMFYRYLKQF